MNVLVILRVEEGFRNAPYLCSEGFVTIGIGTKLHNSKGLNPKDFPIRVSLAMANEWLESELKIKQGKLLSFETNTNCLVYKNLSEDRKAVIDSMAYQMGVKGVLKFRNMWKALKALDYPEAARQALDSKWAKQTPERANRHARIILGESSHEVYGNF